MTFIASAVLFGALHGLGSGYYKVMMVAFIVAIRGTVKQASLLGVAATMARKAVIWATVLVGMWLDRALDTSAVKPCLHKFSAAIIISLALWLIARTRAYRPPMQTFTMTRPASSTPAMAASHLLFFGQDQSPHWRL